MLQIESLLRTLTEPEMEVVKNMNVKGKQREVLQALIRSRGSERSVRADTVGITSEHFHQIVSVLLQRCYTALASDELLALASFLISKNLTKLFYQQLKLQETRQKNASRKEQAKFYYLAFEASQWVTYDVVRLPLVNHFGKQYLQLKENPVPGDKLYIELRILRNTINEVHAAGMTASDKRKRLKQQLDQYRTKVAQAKYNPATYELHVALIEYNILIDRTPLAALTHLHAAEQFIDSIEEPLRREERSFLAAQRADIEFMLGQYQSAYDRYTDIWSSPEKSVFVRRNFCHPIRFSEVATIVGKKDQALAILDARIASGQNNLFITSKLMRYSVIALLDENIAEARELIDKAYKYNTGKSYAYFTDVRIRFLEVVCAYLSGDWELASTLITRSLQFIQRKKVRIVNSDFGYYFKFVDAAIQYNETGKPMPQRIVERVKQQGHFRFFALLLDKIGDKVMAVKAMLLLSLTV